MDTIYYYIAGIAILISSAFLFTYFEDIRNKWKQRIEKVGRINRQMYRDKEKQRRIARVITIYNRNLLAKRKAVAYSVSSQPPVL